MIYIVFIIFCLYLFSLYFIVTPADYKEKMGNYEATEFKTFLECGRCRLPNESIYLRFDYDCITNLINRGVITQSKYEEEQFLRSVGNEKTIDSMTRECSVMNSDEIYLDRKSIVRENVLGCPSALYPQEISKCKDDIKVFCQNPKENFTQNERNNYIAGVCKVFNVRNDKEYTSYLDKGEMPPLPTKSQILQKNLFSFNKVLLYPINGLQILLMMFWE